jgi:hypothetical protein
MHAEEANGICDRNFVPDLHNPLWNVEIRIWRLGEDITFETINAKFVEDEANKKNMKCCITDSEPQKLKCVKCGTGNLCLYNS